MSIKNFTDLELEQAKAIEHLQAENKILTLTNIDCVAWFEQLKVDYNELLLEINKLKSERLKIAELYVGSEFGEELIDAELCAYIGVVRKLNEEFIGNPSVLDVYTQK